MSVRFRESIRAALEAIRADLRDPSNTAAWHRLESRFPDLTRVGLFDKIWWALARRRSGNAV